MCPLSSNSRCSRGLPPSPDIRLSRQTATPLRRSFSGVNLLIVEGEATMRARLRAYLEMILPRCQVLEAGNGPHALNLCAGARPELVLVDAGLKDTSGFELTASLRALSPA